MQRELYCASRPNLREDDFGNEKRERGNAPFLWARQDSNLRPTGYEPAALTAELRALFRSGRRESNPQQQLGRLRQYHFATPA